MASPNGFMRCVDFPHYQRHCFPATTVASQRPRFGRATSISKGTWLLCSQPQIRLGACNAKEEEKEGERHRFVPCDRGGFVDAGPKDDPPSYDAIDSQPLNKVVYGLFRKKMVMALNDQDSSCEGYAGVIDLTRRLNAQGSPHETQERTRMILRSLFPSWLPRAFKVMFSIPFPDVSCKLNAWATWLTCQWLMGPCEINDVEIDRGRIGEGHGVFVKRCRYLEEAGCASVCINSCKLPTQQFFLEDMGLPLTMTPDYSDFSCQFTFGKTPLGLDEDASALTPCFKGCLDAKASSKKHQHCHRIEV